MADLKQFTLFIEEHHASLRYYIAGLGVNPAWVDDVAQDAFVIAYKKWDSEGEIENPGAWLRAIARNVVLNETSKKNRRQRLLNENLAALLAEAEQEEKPGLFEFAERRMALRACLAELTSKARRIIEARYFRDQNSNEIGEELAMKPAAVRKSLFHARQALAECLKRKQAEIF